MKTLFVNKETKLFSLEKGFSSKFVYQLRFLLIAQFKFERASFLDLVQGDIQKFDRSGNEIPEFFVSILFVYYYLLCYSVYYSSNVKDR